MRIITIGDSITEGYVTKKTPKYYPYTDSLKEYFVRKVEVDNRGVSGEKTVSMVDRIGVLRPRKYDTAVILGGTNDLNDRRMGPDSIVCNLIKLHEISKTRFKVSRTFFMSVPVVTDKNGNRLYENKRLKLNRSILEYCDSTSDVYYIPFGEVFSSHQIDERYFSGNGYHLSKTGYRKMAELVAFHIQYVTKAPL